MKLTLEFEEVTVAPSDLHTFSSYQHSGLYIAHDGIAWFIVSAASEGNVFTIPLPSDIILEQYIEKAKEAARIDMGEVISNELSHVVHLLEQLIDRDEISSGNPNLAELTKLIAVAQDPNMLKD